MITLDLIEYIKSQLNKNISKDLIVSRLSQAGWRTEDIEEGFLQIKPIVEEAKEPVLNTTENNPILIDKENEPKKEEPIVSVEKPKEVLPEVKTVDPYRELPDGTEPVIEKTEVKSTPASSLDLLKIWVPTNIKPKIIESLKEIKPESEIKTEPEVLKEAEIEYINVLEKVENPSLLQSEPQIQTQLQNAIEPPKLEIEKETQTQTTPSVSMIELNKLNLPRVEIKQPEEIMASQSEVVSNNISSFETTPQLINKKEEDTSLELNPTINKSPFSKPNVSTISEILRPSLVKVPVAKNGMSDILPRNAMISSYSQDIIASSKEKEEIVPVKKKHSFLKFIIILFTFSMISGMIFAFVEGYLKVPGSNFSFSVVKKDPKTILLNAPSSISKLKSYKVETNINISSPSLSNISIGLSSGKVVESTDRDSISIVAKGRANHDDGKLLFDYVLDFKSSILKNDIISSWKYDGSNLSVSVPDLKEIFKKDAPSPSVVSMEPNQLGLIKDELSPDLQNIIKKIDIYDILSNDVPLYVKNETASILKEFIGGLDSSEKGEESIHGVETYHYEIVADRPSTKKLLSSLVDLYIMELPTDQKKNLDEALGASSFSAFEVWVGKNDNNIYQLKFTLNTPLSKILGLNDSGIAGNEVKLDWTTTYYDLDVENNIVMPEQQIKMEDFIKNIRDIKIKNTISAFKPGASSLRNAIGSYGARSNPNGSCTNPNPGSLFSPQGHSKSADGAISTISSSMIALLSETNGAGSCYSTPGAWALSAPLATSSDAIVPSPSDKNYFYCTDSSGNITTLPSPITGAACK